jgi:hypothetical protein
MIINPRRELIVPAHMTVSMQGFFRIQIRRPDGRIRLDTDWFPNTVLDSGRNYAAVNNFMIACQVGTDNTAPNVNQTALLGYHAGTTDITVTDFGNQAVTPPYYAWKRKTFRFPIGSVAANLTEVGVGWGTTGSTLFSRAFILDPITQNPTTITPLADELMDVQYELRYYPPDTDVVLPQVTLNGVTYDTITRAAEVNSEFWYNGIGNKVIANDTNNWTAFSGDIGTVLQNPSGTSDGNNNGSVGTAAYINNSYQIDVHANVLSTDWNIGGGIRSIRIRTTAGSFQTQFNSNPGGATIPKTNAYTMFMEWRLNWTALT